VPAYLDTEMKRSTILLLSLLFCMIAVGCARTVGHTAAGKPAPAAEDLCMTNRAIIFRQLQVWSFYDPLPPTNLDQLLWVIANAGTFVISNANTFVCPGYARSPGPWTNIGSWTDYIHFDVGHTFYGRPSEIPVLICPPENHHGQFVNVVWLSVNRDRLIHEETARLIKAPWFMVENAYASDT